MIQDVSDQMFDKFVAAARAELETPVVTPSSSSFQNSGDQATPAASGVVRPGQSTGAEPIEVLSFGSAVAGRAAGRAVRRPVFWIAVLILVVIYWLWLR
jgi:hypothetical protein